MATDDCDNDPNNENQEPSPNIPELVHNQDTAGNQESAKADNQRSNPPQKKTEEPWREK